LASVTTPTLPSISCFTVVILSSLRRQAGLAQAALRTIHRRLVGFPANFDN
jgi:hypothetical protein